MDLPKSHLLRHEPNGRRTLVSSIVVFISETCSSCHPH